MEENKDNNMQTEEVKPTSEEQTTAVVNEVKSNEKKSERLIPVLIVFIVIILGLCGYIAYDKIFADKNNKEKETKQKEEQLEEESQQKIEGQQEQESQQESQTETGKQKENKTEPEEKKEEEKVEGREYLSIDDPTVQDLFSKFNSASFPIIDELSKSNAAKLMFAYRQIPKELEKEILCSKLEVNQIPKGSAVLECGYGMNDNKEPNNPNLITKTLSPSIVKSKIEEFFGSDYKYQPEDFSIMDFLLENQCAIMHYDKTNDIYAYYGSLCDGMLHGPTEEITSVYKEENKLVIKTIDNKITRYYEFKKDAKNGNYVFLNYKKIDG